MHPKALVHHQAGLNYQQQGNLRAAAEEYEKALAIDARLDLTRTNLAGVLYQLGEYAGAIEHYRGVLDVQPDNLKIVYNLGVAYSAAGQLTEAVSNFLRCLKLDPNFLPALTSLNWIYQQQENTVGAITVLTQIARLTPEDHATRYQLGVMLKDNQRETEAIARLKELVADHPGHLAGRLLLADLQAIPDAENAWEQLSEIWTRDQGFVGSRDLGERIARNAADRAAKAADPKAEASWLERLLKLRSRDAQVLRRLADLYRSLERTTRAIQLYQELADIRPDDADPQILLAQCLRRTGKRTEAQAALSKILQAHPSHTGALLALADIRLEADRADQAEGLLQRALACDPSLIDARIQLAHVQAKLGRDEEAYQALKALVREQPTHYELRKGGAGLCRKLATAHQREAAGEIPDATGSTSDAARENAAVQALIWWERYLEFVSEDVKVLELLGALYRQRQAHRDASRIYERLVTLKPDPAIWLLFGSCLMASQEPGKAADAFAQAISRMPDVPVGTKDDSVPARVSLAEALEAAGRTAEAVAAAQDALARDPQHAIARELARRGSMSLAEAATAAGQHNEAAARWKYALHLGSKELPVAQRSDRAEAAHTQHTAARA
ncbi:MAG: tetratricopeptide repeat protein, partial [Candidatus Sericytochromatia bacterium]|nr:tetratricopeptide repeat protein [Candidatus Tanganyikabacteria bacterium]